MNQNLTFNEQKLSNPLEFVFKTLCKECIPHEISCGEYPRNKNLHSQFLATAPKGKGSNMHFEITNKIAMVNIFLFLKEKKKKTELQNSNPFKSSMTLARLLGDTRHWILKETNGRMSPNLYSKNELLQKGLFECIDWWDCVLTSEVLTFIQMN